MRESMTPLDRGEGRTMNKPAWQIISSDNWKPHVVPAVFVDALLSEMRERGSEGEIVQRPIEKCGIDRGGMCYANRPAEKFTFCGLDFGVPCEHVEHFYRRLLLETPPRAFGERTYYKLHSHWNCILLTPRQRRQLLASLAMRIERAKAKADAFYADKAVLHA